LKLNRSRVGAIEQKDFNEPERQDFYNLAFALIPDLNRWPVEEKNHGVKIVRARAGADESGYACLLQSHKALRDAVIKIGSR
jgi:hypothetical protein